MIDRNLLFSASLAALALTWTGGSAVHAAEVVTDVKIGVDTYKKYVIAGPAGTPITYYISKTEKPSPIALYIQGSGCTPAFISIGGGGLASTVLSLTTTAHKGEFAVMIVDKPFAPAQRPVDPGVAINCPPEFNAHFSYDNWLSELDAAFRHARGLAWVEKRRALVIGISEGATMAAGLAARDAAVTDVALIGGSGPSQLYDMIVGAYDHGQGGESTLEAVRDIESQVSLIEKDPQSASKFAWGHTFKRWSSFFRASPQDDLKKSRARVYLVSGMKDQNVPIFSSEVNYAELRAAGRDVTFRRIPDAGHGLIREGTELGKVIDLLEVEYVRITDWFKQGVRRP